MPLKVIYDERIILLSIKTVRASQFVFHLVTMDDSVDLTVYNQNPGTRVITSRLEGHTKFKDLRYLREMYTEI